ncbi:phospholipase C, phosphocholine-specific [Solimonas sp. K1W22B-7]|uniref:phosphocholine-specific phospholipase C n=1 Tax=Solimonas sp. K1W22B-7 TaxID=2303331 RepID=UPI000E3329B1|nr:phospholipase C, phosphocholine-specific [Solimonas sp. K1W22B-7]AXQ28914.1 phospholipase C, phosphocholine-specific [Solimonas sp. K1W22B-7]
MSGMDRRRFLQLTGGAAVGTLFPQILAEALSIPAAKRSGTIHDVEHVVILMQENRGFDHYFGTMRGVRGYGDRFTVPQSGGRTVWDQRNLAGQIIRPYHLDSSIGNAQRVDGTPHGWSDAVPAWNKGRFGRWPTFKQNQSMGYYREAELPFQFALANAFTICDAYHCAYMGNTNPNRLFMFTGWNDPLGTGGGPRLYNDNDDLGPSSEGFTWTTYAERLQAAGVSWKVYQDMDDNFTDNSLEGFRNFRLAYENRESEPNNPLLLRGLSTTMPAGTFDGLRNDVLANRLPQVSYVVAPAAYSEHTGPSSPVQGGWFIQETIRALIADPAVWSKTVLLVMFDENDGFFDHVPAPAAPSYLLGGQATGALAGASTADDTGERYVTGPNSRDPSFVGSSFGPGPRVPMYIISPWSRGGWVNSQCFDHTSIVRFLEERFGVAEPNITPYRRAFLGDLSSCFNFANPNDEVFPALPQTTREAAEALRQAQEQLAQIPAPTGDAGTLPQQEPGVRYSRALPYELHVESRRSALGGMELFFSNTGNAGAVFHVYDMNDLDGVPHRYAVEPGKQLSHAWSAGLSGSHDLWVLGPNGFHRRFSGAGALSSAAIPEVRVCYDIANGDISLKLRNEGTAACTFRVAANAYRSDGPWTFTVNPGQEIEHFWALGTSGAWYDLSVTVEGDGSFLRRVAGRVETGRHSVSDPAMATR